MVIESKKEVLVEVKGLKKYFPLQGKPADQSAGPWLRAVDGVDFDVRLGESVGLVGESGCGKTTTGRTILQLHRPTAGEIRFEGIDLTTLSARQMRPIRRKMQMIFQDPLTSLNPRMTVKANVSEPLTVHRLGTRRARQERVENLLEIVGLDPKVAHRYPREFSGGQRQRIGIARALALDPDFIVCDEPVAALDVSIQAQIANLLLDLQEKLSLTYLFIAHDLRVVQRLSDRVGVMYLGRLMEFAGSHALYEQPLHPYTRSLLSAMPEPDPESERRRERIILRGEIPSPSAPPTGCVFRTRCPLAVEICAKEVPEWRNVGSQQEDRWVACHLV